MPEFQPVRFGKYLLLEKFATGGMAQLYRAKITGIQGFEKLIAIKTILPHLSKETELVSSFIDEAKLAALLSHQNIVQIYDFGNQEGSYFISMEFLYGKDLRAIITKARETGVPFSLEHALHLGSRICAGLDYAHNLKDFQGKPLNIIHRDISPQNVFVTYEGDVKILDFGIAKAASQSTITQYGMIKGKVAYMSPEQAAGKPIDQRSDIFSTGILLYEMVTGTRMFTGESTMQILAKVREAEYAPPESVVSGLPPKLYTTLHRALAKEPENRYQSCGEILADIEECMVELSLRPTARGLSLYMKRLFKDEIEAEDLAIRETSGIHVADDAQPPGGGQSITGSATHAATESEGQTDGPPEQPTKGSVKRRWPIYGGIGAVILVVLLALLVWPRERPGMTGPITPGEPPAPAPSTSTAVVPDKAPPVEPAKPDKGQELQAKVKALQGEAVTLAGKDPQKARSLLLESLTLDPNSVHGHFQLGLVYVKLKDYPKAIETYEKAAQLDPQFSDIYFNLGYAYAMNKDYPKAEEMYGRVVKLAPPYLDEALFNFGMVQEKQGKRGEAMANLERALALNPNNALVSQTLAKLKKPSGKKKK